MSDKKSNVTELKNINSERNTQIEEQLQSLLEVAKEGELSDIMIVAKVRGEDMTETIWDTGDRLQLIGALEALKLEVLEEFLDSADAGDNEE